MKKIIYSIGLYILDIVLFLIAWILFLPLSFLNYFIVIFKARDNAKGYFRVSAINFDKYGNKELKTFFNTCMIKSTSKYQFGDGRETISSVMGKVERNSTIRIYEFKIYYWYKKYWLFKYRNFVITDYTLAGIFLNRILNVLDKAHSIKSIIEL